MCQSKKDKLIDQIFKDIDIPFMDMDRCAWCGGYDTMQTYIKQDGKFIHICEQCVDKYCKRG